MPAKKTATPANTKQSETAAVDAYMTALEHPLRDVAAALRKAILEADQRIGEEIAWNAPAFFYTGEMLPFNAKEYKRHIVVFNFFKKDMIRLVFLKGALANDGTGMLEGSYPDGRRLAHFTSVADVSAKQKALQQIVQELLEQIEKV